MHLLYISNFVIIFLASHVLGCPVTSVGGVSARCSAVVLMTSFSFHKSSLHLQHFFSWRIKQRPPFQGKTNQSAYMYLSIYIYFNVPRPNKLCTSQYHLCRVLFIVMKIRFNLLFGWCVQQKQDDVKGKELFLLFNLSTSVR